MQLPSFAQPAISRFPCCLIDAPVLRTPAYPLHHRQRELWVIYAHVLQTADGAYPQVIPVPCGKRPTQTVRWLGAAAIARTDRVGLQGWKAHGMPRKVSLGSFDGQPLPLDTSAGPLTDVLKNGDHVYVTPERFVP
jgi:hypothetical protein